MLNSGVCYIYITMTPIPGTSEIRIPSQKMVSLKETGNNLLTVVNVSELKHPEEKEDNSDNLIWYNQLKYWLIFGCIPSLFFIFLSFSNYRFLFLLPLGPYAAYLTWHVKNKIKRFAKKLDAFS